MENKLSLKGISHKRALDNTQTECNFGLQTDNPISILGFERCICNKFIMKEKMHDYLWLFWKFYKCFGIIASIIMFVKMYDNYSVIPLILIPILTGVVVTIAWMWFVLWSVSYIALCTAIGVIWGLYVSDYVICTISIGVGAIYYFVYKYFNK